MATRGKSVCFHGSFKSRGKAEKRAGARKGGEVRQIRQKLVGGKSETRYLVVPPKKNC